MMPTLPVDAIRESVLAHWRAQGCLVQSPPGSGKTTRIPLWLLEESDQEVVLLLPRRLPVQLAARRLADQLNESVGGRVGYRLRDDSRTGPSTRLTVTTYGAFIRRLQHDPGLDGVGTVILDEFHERQLDQDTCLTLLHACRELFRDDLKLLVMSATLTLDTLQKALRLPRMESDGELHPLTLHYRPTEQHHWPKALVQAVTEARAHSPGHQLVFLPGLRAIEEVANLLPADIPYCIVHSQVAQDGLYERLEQAEPTVILSTNIAESSVTLPGVRTVIDLGRERYPQIHPVTGLTELKTRRISKSSAVQRAGRAARLGPGDCYRLWSKTEQDSLAPDQPPEITAADLTSLVLTLKVWGLEQDEAFWLTPPSAGRWAVAESRLKDWGALDDQGQVTEQGRVLDQLGLEPPLAQLILTGRRYDQEAEALWLAACQATDTPLPAPVQDAFAKAVQHPDPSLKREASRLAKRLNTALDQPRTAPSDAVLIEAWPHRLIRMDAQGRATLANGREVKFRAHESGWQWAVLLSGQDKGSYLLADSLWPLDSQAVFTHLPERKTLSFDPSRKQGQFLEHRWLGSFLLSETPVTPDTQSRVAAWAGWLEHQPLDRWPNIHKAASWLERCRLLARLDPDWPEPPQSSELVGITMPYLNGLKRLNELDPLPVLEAWLGYDANRTLNALCPTHWQAPSGRDCELIYDAAHERVSAALKLQEAFGLSQSPSLAQGKLSTTLELQAPNGRPLAQVTDLPHFWCNIYPDVRKEMRGRYNKHPWPEDPLNAPATRATNRQLRNAQEPS